MTWATHLTVSFLLSCKAANPVLTALCVFGSIFPDMIEGPPSARWLPHRGPSHSLVFWFLCALLLPYVLSAKLYPYLRYFLLGIFSHLFLDSLTKRGIPLFGRYVGLKILRTGGLSEAVFLGAIALFALVLSG